MSEKSKSTIKSIGIVFWVLLLAKIVAFANDAILAAYLGTSMEADAFYMVLGIQQVLYPMLSVGIWKVFLPEYKKRLTLSGRQEADSLANKMLLLFGGISVVFAGLIFIFHKGIVMICAPGLSVEGKALCGELLQISAPLYIFIIISTIIAVMLQCHGKFLGSQIREVVSHIPTIVFAIFLYGKFGVRVLAYSLVVGSILRLLVELPFIDWGFRFQIRAGGFNHEEKKTLKRIPEALLTAGVEQINTLVDKIMASGMAVGSISALNYAHKIMNVFSGLFASAIGTTLYPKMAQLAAENDHQSLENMLRKSICIISFFMVPITIGSLFYSELIIACVFQRGNFGIQATRITAAVYGFYAIGLLFIGLKDILSNILYSYGNTKAAMKVSMITVASNVIMNILFSWFMGANGLALASSMAAVINNIVCLVYLRHYLKISYKSIIMELIKVLAASVLACLISKLPFEWFRIDNIYIQFMIVLLVAVIFYMVIMLLLKSETIQILKGYKKGK